MDSTRRANATADRRAWKPKRAARTGRRVSGERPSRNGTRLALRSTKSPIKARYGSASGPRPSAVRSTERSSITAVPSSSGCASGAGESTSVRPCSARGSSLKNGEALASGWIAEQTSWTKPFRVSSAERTPPPTVSSASRTRTDRPSRARVIAAARPFGPEPTTTASGIFERPDHHVLARGEVQQRVVVQNLDAARWHRVLVDLRFGRLQRPGPVVDLRPLQARGVGRVQAVALREEVRERAGIGAELVSERPVPPAEGRRLAATVTPPALVRQPAASPVRVHVRPEVRELVPTPRALDGDLARGVETEEPDPWLPARGDVRAGVQLEERGQVRNRRKPACAKPRYRKGC